MLKKEIISETTRRTALNMIEQWIKEEEERTKNDDNNKATEEDESN